MPVASFEPALNIPVDGLSGDKIHGGTISSFSSLGIKDLASSTVLTVTDNGVIVPRIEVGTISGNVTVDGDLSVNTLSTGDINSNGSLTTRDIQATTITADRINVIEIHADVRNERSNPLEFKAEENNGSIYGKGLQWTGTGATRQFIFQANPDRLWSTDSIDLRAGKELRIDNTSVLSKDTLGNTVTRSNLQTVGRLQNLTTTGDLNIDQFVFYNSTYSRLGIGTDAPNAALSIADENLELIFGADNSEGVIGNWTSHNLKLVTDNTSRITIKHNGDITIGQKGNADTKVNMYGKLGVGVTNPDEDVSLTTAGNVRFNGRKFMNGSSIPTTGYYRKGDIILNDEPLDLGYVGWVCTRDGTPGKWLPFGTIGRSSA